MTSKVSSLNLNGRMLEPFQRVRNRVPVNIDEPLCTGCELCIYACPQAVLKAIPDASRIEGLVAIVYNPALCTACRQSGCMVWLKKQM